MGLSICQGKLAIVMELLDGDLEKLLITPPSSSNDRKQQIQHQSPTLGSPRSLRKKKEVFSLYQRLMMAKDAALGMNWLHSRDPAIIHRYCKGLFLSCYFRFILFRFYFMLFYFIFKN